MSEPKEKQYSLKPIELQLIANIQDAAASNILSFICSERLAYQVTPTTRFRVEAGELYVSEVEFSPAPEVST